MGVHEMFYDRETQTGAFSLARTRLVPAIEALEYPRKIQSRNARAGILDAYRNTTVRSLPLRCSPSHPAG